jgi:hypothetical protein
MQSPTRQVHVLRAPGDIQSLQLARKLRSMCSLYAALRPLKKKAFDSLMPKALYHL